MPDPSFVALCVVLFLIGVAVTIAGSRTTQLDTIERGRELLQAGQTQEALRVFERLSRQRSRNAPGRERSLYWLARCYEELGLEAAAKECYRRYLEEYVFTSAGPRSDQETEQLVRERLARFGIVVGPEGARELHPNEWERYKASIERRAARDVPKIVVNGPSSGVEKREVENDTKRLEKPEPRTEKPEPKTEKPVTKPVETVSPERVAKDEDTLIRGRRIGDYVLAEKLGEGGFGEVFRALRPVAIKLARDPAVIEQLRRFGTIQGQVDSDRVVRPLEVNLENDPPYVVMELVDGCTLRDLLASRRLAPSEALGLLKEVALGLRDAHSAGVLHLDLKPENVLLDESGKVKLTDFELGKMTPEAAQFRLSRSLGSSSVDAKLAGTIAYMSPEQRDGKVPDARSDVYTFGILLFESLTGELPQPGDKPSDLVKDLPHSREIDRIFERCFTRHERRFSSTYELSLELESLVGKLPLVDLKKLMERATDAKARVDARSKAWEKTASEKALAAAKKVETPPRKEAPEPARTEAPRAEPHRVEARVEPHKVEPKVEVIARTETIEPERPKIDVKVEPKTDAPVRPPIVIDKAPPVETKPHEKKRVPELDA